MSMQLVQQATTDFAKTYKGASETATFTFSTGPTVLDFIQNFFVNQFILNCEGAIGQESPGDHLLSYSLYRDTSNFFQTDYQLVITSTDITLNQLPWALIIQLALAVIVALIVIPIVLKDVSNALWTLLEPIKQDILIPVLIAGGIVAVPLIVAMFKGTSIKQGLTGK